MIKNISGIKYGPPVLPGQPDNRPAGQAFGGGIYSASCNIGFANSPTKISLSIVSEDSNYEKPILDVTEGGHKTISIGGTITTPAGGGAPVITNQVDFNRMYLYSYSYNNTAGSKTLTVNFVDHSLCLDKIFVGLTGRHATKTVHPEQFNPAAQIQVYPVQMTFGFRLMCLECNEMRPFKQLKPPSWAPPQTITRSSYIAGDGTDCEFRTYINVERGMGSINGGYIILGAEQFKDTECEIPNVTYTFDDLCNALDHILGGDPHGCNGTPKYRHNLREFKRSATYEASYTGTLREVLSAWAADFSFDFTFSYETDDLWVQGIDLKDPIDLTEVKNAISTGFGPDSEGGLIRSHVERHTLENTYYQTPLVKYIKPPRPFSRAKTHYESMVGKVLTPMDALGSSANLGRSDDELYVSMALAKYSDEIRLIWLSDLARVRADDIGARQGVHSFDANGNLIPDDLEALANANFPCGPNATAMDPCPMPISIGGKLITEGWCNPFHDSTQGAGQAKGPGGCPPCGANPWLGGLPRPGSGLAGHHACSIDGSADPEFDPTVHGYCSKSGYGTKADCQQGGGAWFPSADDPRLRRDTPWTALGFFPAISFNTPVRIDTATLLAYGPTLATATGGNGWKIVGGKRVTIPSQWSEKQRRVDGWAAARDSLANAEKTYKKCIDQFGQTWNGLPACYAFHSLNEKANKDYIVRMQAAGNAATAGNVGFNLCKKTHPIFCDATKFSVYLGIWNEAYQDAVGDFDKELANNFLGQYGYWWGNRTSDAEVAANPPIFNYGPINPPPNERQCPKYHLDLEGGQKHAMYHYQHLISTLPESKIYSGHSYPFDNILRANGGFFAIPPGVVDTAPHCSYCPQRSVFQIEDNAWGTPPNQLSQILRNKYIVDKSPDIVWVQDPQVLSDLNIYIPKFSRLDSRDHQNWMINTVGIENWQGSIIKPEYMKSGYWPGIAFIPHVNKMTLDIQDNQGNIVNKPILKVDYSHWRDSAGNYAGIGSEVVSALVYQNFIRRQNESLIGPPSDCILYCEEDIQQELCACPEIDEPIHGFQSHGARYLEVTHLGNSTKLLFPVEHIYTGFWVSQQQEKGTTFKKQIVMGEPPDAEIMATKNVMGTRIVDIDATGDLDALEATSAGNFQEQLMVTNSWVTPPIQEVVTLEQYYTFLLGTEQSADEEGEQIDVKVDGTEFDELAAYLTPASGLSSFNISLSGDGISTNLSFHSKPAKLPKRDVLLQKIGPRALEGRVPKTVKNVAARGAWHPPAPGGIV